MEIEKVTNVFLHFNHFLWIIISMSIVCIGGIFSGFFVLYYIVKVVFLSIDQTCHMITVFPLMVQRVKRKVHNWINVLKGKMNRSDKEKRKIKKKQINMIK